MCRVMSKRTNDMEKGAVDGPGYLGRLLLAASRGLDEERAVLRKLKMQCCTWAARERRHTEGEQGTEDTVLCLEQSGPGNKSKGAPRGQEGSFRAQAEELGFILSMWRAVNWGVRAHGNFLKSKRREG